MTVIAYKWGGIAFDDKSLIKRLILPTNSYNATSYRFTFHDEAGANYVVPAGKVFICGAAMLGVGAANPSVIGESDTADAVLSKIIFSAGLAAAGWGRFEVLAVFAAGKYVTGYCTFTSSSTDNLQANSCLYGVVIDA